MTLLLLAIFGLVSAPPAPLDEGLSRTLATLPADPPGTNNDTHYVVSNERRLDLFAKRAGDHAGGAYIGVGAEQNYVLIGWSRPEVAVLLDFDPVIGDLHRLHLVFLARAERPDVYVDYWSRPPAVIAALLATDLPDPSYSARALAAFEQFAPVVGARLRDMAADPSGGVDTYLSDPEQFERVRALVMAGRVFVAQGDLTASGALQAVASALHEGGLTVRTLYLSNAEQYFMYRDDFRRNMAALPMDARTIVLRTLPGRPRDFEYITQRGPRFQAWVASKRVRSVYAIRGLRRGEHLVGETAFEARGLPR